MARILNQINFNGSKQKMNNIKRHPDYIKIRQRIKSCGNPEQLERLRQVVIRFNNENKTDGPELMSYFLEKEQDLSADYKNEREFEKRNGTRDLEEDSQESLWYDRYEGAEIESMYNQRMNGFHSRY